MLPAIGLNDCRMVSVFDEIGVGGPDVEVLCTISFLISKSNEIMVFNMLESFADEKTKRRDR